MTASSGLALPVLTQVRERFVRNLNHVAATPEGRAEARERLTKRLAGWQGMQTASGKSRFKNKISRGAAADCSVGADEAETIIVRALSLTRRSAQFTISPNGAVFATEQNGWTIDGQRIYVSGLSPLIDDAADILQQMRDRSGGRMYFTDQNEFIRADSKLSFLRVLPDSSPAIIRAGGLTAAAPQKNQAVCPTCFQYLSATGTCGTCA